MPTTGKIREKGKQFNDTGVRDAFARGRVSEPFTLWDSKQLGDNRALFWDDAETRGEAVATSTYNFDGSSTILSVAADTDCMRVRQTKMRFNYQPGKSHSIAVTGTLGAAAAGITRRVGYFDDENGVFYELNPDGLFIGLRSSVTGTPVDTLIPQAEWDVPLNHPRVNSYQIDTTKSQIFNFDMEWLGVGTVRYAFFIDGVPIYVYAINNANNKAGVYMRTPNLPIRYEIENDGTGGAASLECICSTVISEGGQQVTGKTTGLTTVPTHVDANVADTSYAIIGMRLKSSHIDNVVKIVDVNLLNEQNANFYWELMLNPTVAGSFVYADLDNSPIQVAYGVTANTVTGGSRLDCGLSRASSVASNVADTLLYLGSFIDGTVDTMVLCCTPLGAAADIQATMTIQFS